MCGIVGLHLKNPGLHPRLGELLAAMLDCMSSRGPDSAGLSLYSDAAAGRLRLSLRGDGLDWTALAQRLTADLGGQVDVQDFGDAATLSAPGETARVLTALQDAAPEALVVGHGRAMEVVKDVGHPREICAHYRIGERGGYQGIGHTRMATESAVTTEHSHPFAPRADMALVHNGSFSNPAT